MGLGKENFLAAVRAENKGLVTVLAAALLTDIRTRENSGPLTDLAEVGQAAHFLKNNAALLGILTAIIGFPEGTKMLVETGVLLLEPLEVVIVETVVTVEESGPGTEDINGGG